MIRGHALAQQRQYPGADYRLYLFRLFGHAIKIGRLADIG